MKRLTIFFLLSFVALISFADGEVTDVPMTDSITLSNVSPNSTIMLYKQNYIPYIAPLVLQNVTLDHSQYVIATDVLAGRAVDNNRTSGNVIVPEEVEYEIEASGTVRLAGGFKVEKGATFAIRPASYKN